jgi:hypothetical protein
VRIGTEHHFGDPLSAESRVYRFSEEAEKKMKELFNAINTHTASELVSDRTKGNLILACRERKTTGC